MVRDFRDLQVWNLGMEMAEDVYRLTSAFPASERYGLALQMRRAAVSVPSNIAEGHARQSDPELARFLAIAAGSAAELRTQATLAGKLAFAPQDRVQQIITQAERLAKLTPSHRPTAIGHTTKKPRSKDLGFSVVFIRATSYSPTQLPAQYHRG